MRLFRFLRPISSALAVLREEILAVVGRHVTIDPDKVQIREDRGAEFSILALNIQIPNKTRMTATARAN